MAINHLHSSSDVCHCHVWHNNEIYKIRPPPPKGVEIIALFLPLGLLFQRLGVPMPGNFSYDRKEHEPEVKTETTTITFSSVLVY
jgi:hypothetical protein